MLSGNVFAEVGSKLARKHSVKNQQSIDENPDMEQIENDQTETLK